MNQMERQTFENYDEDNIDIQYYLMLLRIVVDKNYKAILALMIATLTFTFFYVESVEPTYTASATLHLAPPDASGLSWEQYSWDSDTVFQNTQMGILQSKRLMSRVVKKLGLYKPEPAAMAADKAPPKEDSLFSTIKHWFASSPVTNPEPPTEDELIESVATGLMGAVAVTPANDREFSYLLHLSVTWDSPDTAAAIVNTVADSYIALLFEKEVQQTIDSESFLSERLAQLKTELGKAEERLQQFKEQQDIVDRASGRAEIDDELDDISARYLRAKETRLETEEFYAQVKNAASADLKGIPGIASYPRISRLADRIVDIDTRRRELGRRYGPKHNKMIALEAEASAAAENFAEESTRVIDSIRRKVETARKNEDSLAARLAGLRTNKQALGRTDFRIQELQQDVETKREVYNAFLERLNQSSASGPVRNNNIWVVDPATVPKYPNLPSMRRYMLLASVLSLFLGLGIGVLLELMRSTIANPDEVEKLLGIPVLGVLPDIEHKEEPDEISPDIHNTPFIEYKENSASQYSEAIRSVRTSLMLLAQTNDAKRILVTSSEASEGKSSIALTLATSFGQLKKVLLIDCDLRKPSLEKILNSTLHKKPGLADVIAGVAKIEDCVVVSPETGIDILYAGNRTLNPLELISSPQFNLLLTKFSERYNMIFIDSPPCLPVSDAYLLASLSDLVLFTIRAETTKVSAMRNVLKKLAQGNTPIAGAILNRLNLDSVHARGYQQTYDYYAHTEDKEAAKNPA